jgi:AAA+ superfamily predicted ATPase
VAEIVMDNSWIQANQTCLVACINHVKALLKHHIDGVAGSFVQTEKLSDITKDGNVGLSAIENICLLFGLSPFEKQVLILCAAYELDSEVKSLLAQVHGNPNVTYPTFGVALSCFPDSHWSAIAPVASLRKFQLLDLNQTPTTSITTSPIRISERVLHYLTGIFYIDHKLQGIIKPAKTAEPPVKSHMQLVKKILDTYQNNKKKLPLTQLCGIDETDKIAIAQTALTTLGLNLWQLPAELIPQNTNEATALAHLWTREATLLNAGLIITAQDADPQTQKNTLHFTEQLTGPLFLTTKEPNQTQNNTLILQVNKPLKTEQHQLWQTNLKQQQYDPDLQNTITALTSQFNLTTTDIKTATTQATQQTNTETLKNRLWTSACAISRPKISDLAQQITPKATLNNIILPECEKQQLQEIIIHANQRHKVYQEWGFETTNTRGLGLNALFSGTSGTGKTMAAEAIAHELHLDLYRIDLSAVVNKYIGETEKNLNKLFNTAEDGGTILFFDEADALFGKRTETKDSHDRYANIEINYLLQRMENYRGITILATNLKNNLDPAFTRRLKFIINFPFPNEKNRLEIWKNIYPKQTPISNDVNFTQLAKLNITGGNIHNIALYSAFLAANQNTPINIQHIKRATQIEYTKIEKPLTGNWPNENQH